MNVETLGGTVVEIDVGERDVLMLTYPKPLSVEVVERLRHEIAAALRGDVPALVLSDGLQLMVLHRDAVSDRTSEQGAANG